MNGKGFGTGSGVTGLVAAGGAAVALIAAGVYFSTQEMTRLTQEDVEGVTSSAAPVVVQQTALPDAPTQDVPANAKAPEDDDSASAVATSEAEEPEPEAPSAVSPRIDEVRVETDGAIVVAGRADPGARVDVLVDDEVVATVDADRSGAFAALSTLSASDSARKLTLRSGEGAAMVASADEIILAPVRGPAEAAAPVAPPDDASGEDVAALAVTEEEAPVQDDTGSALPDDSSAAEAAQTAGGDVLETGTATAEVAPAQPAAPDPVADTAEVAGSEREAATETETDTQIAVLRSDESGVTLLAPQPPATSVELDTIGYNDAGEVQLSGRAETGSVEIRAYLNNRAVARLPVDTDGSWRGDVPEIDTGIYTLRVDAVDAEGAVISRIETPFKREAPAVLAAATSDAAGAARAVTVQAGDTLWAIARDRYGEGLLYVQVFEANRSAIRDPDLIYPGQVFDLPGD